MKAVLFILICVLISLQYRLWVGEGSLAHLVHLQQQIATQEDINQRLKARNSLLAAEVNALRSGTEAIEGRAREDMGMIKQGETFYLIVGEDNN